MSDLPIYRDSPMLRSGLQFADLLPYKNVDTNPIWLKAAPFIAQMEGASSVLEAREVLREPSKVALMNAHAILFAGQPGAGLLRTSNIAGRYRGQDCPDPEFIERSLDNFFSWMTTEAITDIHPIEKAGLVFTRIIDIWPFQSGNLTMAIVLSNAYLEQAGLPPFFVRPEHRTEFDKVIAQAITIETQPLVSAIHQTITRELERNPR
jgi:Fic family protein